MTARQIIESSPYYDESVYARLGVMPDDSYPLVSCNCCHFNFAGVVPDDGFLARLYGDSDGSGLESRIEVFARPQRMAQQLTTYAELLRIIANRVQLDPRGVPAHKVRVLDFGCGIGAGILALCRQGFPYETYATDFSAGTLTYLSSQGVCTAEGLDGIQNATDLDAVVLSDVLEHVPDPATLVEQVALRASRMGVIWISVPNFIDWRMRAAVAQVKSGGRVMMDLNPWEHLSYFSPSSLDALMSKVGFERAKFGQVDLTVNIRGSNKDRLMSAVRLLRDFIRAHSGKYPNKYTTTAAFVRT